MQGWHSLNWLPRLSSFGRSSSFGFFSKILTLISLISLIFVSSAVYGAVFAQTTTTSVSFSGSGSSGTIGIVGGYTLPINVRVDNITNSSGLAAFAFKIGYNPNLISIPDANNDYIADTGIVSVGPFLGSSGKQVNCGDGYIDTDLNDSTKQYLSFICTTLGPTPAAASGSGVLTTVNFKTGNSVSSVPLSFVTAELADNTADANLISNTTVNTNAFVDKCADFTGDHLVLIGDISAIINHYRGTDLTYDLNSDGYVNITDVTIGIAEYRKTCTR